MPKRASFIQQFAKNRLKVGGWAIANSSTDEGKLTRCKREEWQAQHCSYVRVQICAHLWVSSPAGDSEAMWLRPKYQVNERTHWITIVNNNLNTISQLAPLPRGKYTTTITDTCYADEIAEALHSGIPGGGIEMNSLQMWPVSELRFQALETTTMTYT